MNPHSPWTYSDAHSSCGHWSVSNLEDSLFSEWSKLCLHSITKTHMISIFLDFSKVFSTVDQEIMFKKLECCGKSGHVLKWISSYISEKS